MNATQYDHAVIVAGAGPTGLMLAGELALAGVDVAIVERRPDQQLSGQRALGLHAGALEVFEQRGIADRFLAAGEKAQVAGFAGVRLDISDLPTPHPYGLALVQAKTEAILAGWIGELGVTIHRGCDLTGFTDDEAGVTVAVGDGRRLRAQYLVGCDGGRSTVRRLAGVDFVGTEATTSNLIAQAELTEEPTWGIHRDAIGIHAFSKLPDGKRAGILVTERSAERTTDPTVDDLREAMIAVYGTDFGLHDPVWISRFTDATRQATTYRKGRVLVAGDAAHTHPPDGGHGLQTGLMDAVNLGWKLGLVTRGLAPDALLDSYHAERHPVGALVLRNALAAVALRREDDRTKALRAVIAELLEVPAARRLFAAEMSELDIHYDLGSGHPMVGRRVPDVELATAAGQVRTYALLHGARGVLIDLGGSEPLDAAGWEERVTRVEADYRGPWELPGPGLVPAPKGLLVRPDGHVAWVGGGDGTGLREALGLWFGPAR